MTGTASSRNRCAPVATTILLLQTLLVVAGCGPRYGDVSGRVLFDGKPMPGGTLMFRPVDTARNPVTAQIDQDGNFSARIPVGECKISVDNRGLQFPSTGPIGVAGGGERQTGKFGGPPKSAALGPPKDAMGAVEGRGNAPEISVQQQVGTYLPIPPQYYDPETSGLTMTVKSGKQTHTIELTRK